LLVLAFAGAERVRAVNVELAAEMKPVTRPLHAVNLFVKKHRHEADFSIAIEYDSSDPVPQVFDVPVTRIIFRRWLADEPKYWIAIRGGKAVVVRKPLAPEPRAEPPAPGSPVAPGVGRTSQHVGGLASRPDGGIGDARE
jgi:hypothetical protein